MLLTLRRLGRRSRSLWGVLLMGIVNTLLWEQGTSLFPDEWSLLLCFAFIAFVSGVLTPEKPVYTTIVLSLGSPLPLPHVPPIACGLWPFLALAQAFRSWPYDGLSVEEAAGIIGLLLIVAVSFGCIVLSYGLFVHAGWILRLHLERRRYLTRSRERTLV